MSNTVRIGNQSISYEQAKDMLFPELIPQKGNEALLSAHPHDKVEDLAVLYRLDLHSGDGTMMSARVTQGLLDAFGVSAEQMKRMHWNTRRSHTRPLSVPWKRFSAR